MASNGAKAEASGRRRLGDLARSALGRRREPALGALTGDRAPVELVLSGARPDVLAFHGFGGTPFEVELVLDVARELGLGALAPLLPGHGTHANDLSRTRFDDWSRAAEAALDRVTRPAILVGLSMGSLLALDLAQRRPEAVGALVLLANATRLSAPSHYALALAERLRVPDFLAKKRAGPDIADGEGRTTHVSYDAHPIHAAMDVRRAGHRIAEQLGRVRCPTLILHGALDRVCPVANAWSVAARLGTDDARVVIFARSRHILTRDRERDAVRAEIFGFLQRMQSTLGGALAAQTPVEP